MAESLEQHSALQEIADEHPYYAIAQLDLLKSFDSNRTPAFHQQAAKTALFFSNTYWLSWQLHQSDEDDDDQAEILTEQPKEPEEKPANPAEPVREVRIEKEEDPIEVKPVELPPVEVSVPQTIEEKKVEEIPADDASPKAEAATADQDLIDIPFEPLHTVDYFASQGIKLTEEPITNDKLGKQMKSFTEWLKSMKRIGVEKLPAGDEQTDRRIQHIADESNSQADVVTEAMAEVYVMQGKPDKAREVYSKLSLINPSKSAYFAAKIESLKAN